MAISLILSAIFVVLLLIGAGLVAWCLYTTKFKKISLAGTIVILVAVLCLALIPGSFHTVEAGQVAVVKHLGEAKKVRTANAVRTFISYFRPKRLLKRSTRPPVSTSFCLPV